MENSDGKPKRWKVMSVGDFGQNSDHQAGRNTDGKGKTHEVSAENKEFIEK